MSGSSSRTDAVLIADDDALVRMVLRMAIENLGHEVVDVHSAAGLHAALTAGTFGLCIMDALIPDSTLEERLGIVDALAPAMPIIVLSAYSDRPDVVKNRGLAFMSKPIGLMELTGALVGTGLVSGSSQAPSNVGDRHRAGHR